MTNTLEQAFAKAADMPDAVQDSIGRDLLAHIEKLRALQVEIDRGMASLDAGEGRTVDVESLILDCHRSRTG